MRTLQQITTELLTMQEASTWIGQHLEEYGLARAPKADTLKAAARQGRLKSISKSHIYFTREKELREYLKNFDPKNKTESRPLKPRAERTRRQRQEQEAKHLED